MTNDFGNYRVLMAWAAMDNDMNKEFEDRLIDE